MNNLNEKEKHNKDENMYKLFSLLTVFLITGIILLIKGAQLEEYLNNDKESLSDFQRIGLYFIFLVIFVYLIRKIIFYLEIRSKIHIFMAIVTSIMLLNLFIIIDALTINTGLYQVLPGEIQGIIVFFGFISLYIIFYFIVENIFLILNSYLEESNNIDSKAAFLISLFVLIISFLSLIS